MIHPLEHYGVMDALWQLCRIRQSPSLAPMQHSGGSERDPQIVHGGAKVQSSPGEFKKIEG